MHPGFLPGEASGASNVRGTTSEEESTLRVLRHLLGRETRWYRDTRRALPLRGGEHSLKYQQGGADFPPAAELLSLSFVVTQRSSDCYWRRLTALIRSESRPGGGSREALVSAVEIDSMAGSDQCDERGGDP